MINEKLSNEALNPPLRKTAVMRSLPTEKECLEMAFQLTLDYEPEKIITKEEENKKLGLNSGDVLPPEYLYYEEHLLKLIKYCQGNIA